MLNAVRGMLVLGDQRVTLPRIAMTGMQSMASKMWVPFVVMGVMAVLASLALGAVNAGFTSDYFAFPKEAREAAAAGSNIVDKKVFIETTNTWLPSFFFLGMGLLLGGITFLLASILGNLRVSGAKVQQALGREIVGLKPPWSAQLFPMFMMLGLMILVANFLIHVALAFIAHGYWNHSIATELNTAVAGSGLLADLQTLETYGTWLEPFKFLGVAFLLAGIALALYTIVRVLRFQAERLKELAFGEPQ